MRKRNFSDFWSDTEYKAIKGLEHNRQARHRAIQKAMRALNALEEIENRDVVTKTMATKAVQVAKRLCELAGVEFVGEVKA